MSKPIEPYGAEMTILLENNASAMAADTLAPGSTRSSAATVILPIEVKQVPVFHKEEGIAEGFDCVVHPGVQNKSWVSEIDLSQPRHETAFWWRHKGPVMSQLTDPTKWPNYPLELIRIYVHKHTQQRIPDTKMS